VKKKPARKKPAKKRPAKKKAARKRSTRPSVRNHTAIEPAVLLIVSGCRRSDLVAGLVDKLGVDPRDVEAVLLEARRRITLAADYDRDEEIGTAKKCLEDLYNRSITANDLKTALASRRESNKLMDLYQSATPGPGNDHQEDAQTVRDELDQVRRHLEPLGLAPAGTAVAELARLAVARLLTT